MEALVITWREVLLLALIILLIYIAEMFLLMRGGGLSRLWRRGGGREERQELDLLWEKLDGLAQEQDHFREELRKVHELLEKGANPAYAQAMELAGRGRSAVDIAGACGITRGEAELIVDLVRARG